MNHSDIFRSMDLKSSFLGILLFLLFSSCDSSELPFPKQRGYPRIEFPVGRNIDFKNSSLPFQFQYPDYFQITRDSSLIVDQKVKDYWFNLQLSPLNSSIHFSYYPITGENQLEKLVNDAFKMAHFHNKKANYIEELPINISSDITGIEFFIKGPAATPYQFYLTDSKKHFIRGVFYVKAQVNVDSLAPIHTFMIQDIQKIIGGFSWVN